jgi:hypothetical protein
MFFHCIHLVKKGFFSLLQTSTLYGIILANRIALFYWIPSLLKYGISNNPLCTIPISSLYCRRDSNDINFISLSVLFYLVIFVIQLWLNKMLYFLLIIYSYRALINRYIFYYWHLSWITLSTGFNQYARSIVIYTYYLYIIYIIFYSLVLGPKSQLVKKNHRS